MGKSSPSPPPPVDVNALIQGQETSGINTAIAQMLMNMQNRSGPWGSLTYNPTGYTTVDGIQVPQFSQTSTLSPQLQGMLGAIPTGPMQDPKLFDQNTINAIYGQAQSRLNPQWQQSQNQLYDKLAEQGITPGSQAYGQATQNFNTAKNDAYNTALNSAIGGGMNAASQLFGEDLQARNEPLQQFTSLLSSLTGTQGPSPQVSITAPNVLGDYSLQQQGLWNNYNAQEQQYQSMLGGLGSLGGSILPFLMMAGMPFGM